MKTLFVFGGGASYGSGCCNPKTPPLGHQLFDELLKHCPSARQLPEDVQTKFQEKAVNGLKDFEKGMDYLFDNYSELVSPFLSEMAQYFTRFHLYAPQYPELIPVWINHYETLIKIILANNSDVVLSTTNYELLIEDAIELAGKEVSYDFEEDNNCITLFKFHGSCNFIPDMNGGTVNGLSFQMKAGQQIMGTERNGFLIVEKFNAVRRGDVHLFCGTNNSLSPAIAMYAPSKEVICGREIIRDQYQRWLKAVDQVERIIIIGLRIYKNDKGKWSDRHILNAFSNTQAELYYVGKEPEDFKMWASENNKSNIHILAKTFAESLSPISKLLDPNSLNGQVSTSSEARVQPRWTRDYGKFKGL